MKITIKYLIEGSKNAKGVVVIIDVLRACTTIPILFSRGVKKIIPVSTPEEAIKYEEFGYVLIGEGEHGHKHDTFHHINSPSEVYIEDFIDKNAVIRSNNATQAILNANKASDVILASFVNLKAIVNYIRKLNPQVVTLVALGRLGERGLEDDLCAEAIENNLKGEEFDFDKMKRKIEVCDCAIHVSNTLQKPKDVEMALILNSYPIVPLVIEESGVKTIVQANAK